jgi:hypothetical protein
MKAYKVLTHDLRSPIQGSDPLFDASWLPYQLPHVDVDTSDDECGAGWNACRDAATALRIGGMWPDGRPSRVFELHAVSDHVVERGDKLRAATWYVRRELGEDEIEQVISDWTATWAGEHSADMTHEQMAWRRALARPHRDETAVVRGLQAALDVRGLGWSLRKYEPARAALGDWAAWAALGDWAAWAAWDARDAWDARAALGDWAAWAALGDWAAWAAWDARDAWDAWDARAARGALCVQYTGRREWIVQPADLLTVGIRDAYEHGLGTAVPVRDGVLGWAMD